ncbi:PEGA domain-containing protein [[Clostridium] fimetarium]|uniref:PEGA domain-containing protein n=1 Tax=[Clostridium] fimetarium TaxID=99656 RepID=A0A1I0P020_9FIRM|nr:PEGA domain-containing protein [[Clostridium] fimetarium]SEW07293.1 PEGA domain-containing protein [[Clostridium] fimetarium]
MKITKEHLNIKDIKLVVILLVLVMVAGLMAGCSSSTKKSAAVPGSSILPIYSKTNSSTEKTNSNEIKMTGVLTYLDATKLKMHFVDVESGSEYEVNYTGGTDIQNKHQSIIASSQMALGDVFNVVCNKSGKALTIFESSDVWENSGITNFGVNEASLIMTIGTTNYKYTSSTVTLSNNSKINPNEIMSQDVLTVRGIGKTIYSVTVDRGHGYVRFSGYSPFVGGYVDIGTKLILLVSENMVVTAPEGEYKIAMQLGSLQGSKTVVIQRDKDITVDFSEYKAEVVKTGAVLFSVTPSNAVIYIDGSQVDYSKELQLNYGSHTVILKANNYTTYSETFIVNSVYEKKIIDMVSTSTTSTRSTKSATTADLTSGYSVNIKLPEGAAVYVDSVYIGIVPVSFTKSSGNKVISFTKSGCATKSYTISIANATGDLNYSFPNMEAETATVSATK